MVDIDIVEWKRSHSQDNLPGNCYTVETSGDERYTMA
jgi:hypothetical protein